MDGNVNKEWREWRGYIHPEGWERPVYAVGWPGQGGMVLLRDKESCEETERHLKRDFDSAVFAAITIQSSLK